jgi:predicted ATP-grasp superfamily ATP-dependent carboligase
MVMSSDVILMGASVRALAASALRAGLVPWCADLFGDVDLARACAARVLPLAQYPGGFVALARDAPNVPWMYTGGIENAPELVDQMPRRLWGIGGEALRAARDPQGLQALGLPLPALATTPDERDARRRWLLKPLRSSGGLEIRPWQAGMAFDASQYYLQELRAGVPCSAVFLGRADGTARLVGASRQIIGATWLHARPFLYAGSIGPLPLPPRIEAAVRRWGEVLASALGLRGIFGCDFLLDDDRAWLLEVNPRYTASVEILERASGEALLASHVAAFAGRASTASLPQVEGVHGKAVLYAREAMRFPERGPWLDALDMPLASLHVAYADIPRAGSVIARGRPVLTFFAAGGDSAACEGHLREIARDLDRRLWGR